MMLTPEELLAGKSLTFDVAIPPEVLNPARSPETKISTGGEVRLRPLTVKDVQLIAKAAREDEVLTSVLMIQRALVEPKLKQQDIGEMPSGLVRFLIEHINRISGLTTDEEDVRAMAESPLVQAFFVLAREFNWTPDQVRSLTVGQVVGYLEMLSRSKKAGAE
jgi:hypothetical protein